MNPEPWPIPDAWRWVQSQEIAQIVGGSTPRTDDPRNFEGGDVAWITPADLSGYKSKSIGKGARNISVRGLNNSGARILPAGTVLFSSRAPIGYVAIAANALATNQGFKSFVLSKAVMPDYAYYYLQRARDIAIELSSGTTFREISGANTALIPFPVAPLNEQRRIVAEIEKQFTRLDAAVAALKRIQANLKRYRASILKAACEGRLVPTEAELARRENRSYEPASELLKRVLTERRSRWQAAQQDKFRVDSKESKNRIRHTKYKEPSISNLADLPNLPEGWTWATVEALSLKVVDGVHKKPQYVENGIPFVTVRNLTSGRQINFEDLNHITRDDHRQFIKRADPKMGDLLVTKDGTLGVIRAVRTDKEFSIFVSVAMVRPANSEMTDYLETALASPQMQAQMVPKGSGLQHIHLEDLRLDSVPLPPLAEQKRIADEVQRRLSVLDELETELQSNPKRSIRLRQSILKRAFEGKLVPQDPDDEPASVLLERIRADRSSSTGFQPVKKSRGRGSLAHAER